MSEEYRPLDLIDLISERHLMLRKLCEKIWNDNHAVVISYSEWHIMARVGRLQPTISQVAKQADISRQAAHKFIKRLEAKGLIEIVPSHNNKEKRIRLTALGETCLEKNQELKASLENKIAEAIGKEQVETLKKLLLFDWRL